MKKFKKLILTILLVVTSMISFSDDNKDVIKDDYQGAFEISKYWIRKLSYAKDKKEDKELSKFIVESLIERLDPGKMLYTKEDIKFYDDLKPIYTQLSTKDMLEIGVSIIYKNLERIKRQYDYAIKQIKEYNFDFKTDDVFYLDREKLDYVDNLEKLDELWRKKVLNDVERLIIAGEKKKNIQKILLKRYTSNRNNLLKITNEEKNELVVSAYVRAFDPHNEWFSPSSAKDFEISQSLNLVGIGAQIQQRGESNVITNLIKGGPAEKSKKFKVGDIFVYVGEGEKGELVDVSTYRLKDLVKLLRGSNYSVVRVGVRANENAPVRIIKLVREEIKQEDEQIKSKIVKVGNKKVGYIVIPSFYTYGFDLRGRSVARDLGDELANLEKNKVDSLVIDLRNNPGGSLPEVISMLRYFIGEKKVAVQVKDEKGRIKKYYTEKINPNEVWKKPLVVMINRLSASASEIFAGAIKDYNRGVIVGTNTWGKGTVQSIRQMKFEQNGRDYNLGLFKFTIEMFFRANGSSTQLKGVKPDIEYVKLKSEEDNGEQKEYKNALNWEKIASAINDGEKFTLKKDIDTLKKLHNMRIENDKKWNLVSDQIMYANSEYDTKLISLNLEKRRDRRNKREKKQKEFKNRAIALNVPVETIFVLDDGLSYNENDIEKQNKEKKILDEYIDPYTIEAAKISLDLI